MDVTCVLQARTGSTRLPGKVLADLDGEPLLAFLLRRITSADLPIVVATSTEPQDDAVEAIADGLSVPCVRGSERDVLARYEQATRAFPSELVVRLTADNPLLDLDVVRRCIDQARTTGADYVSNTLIRTFPDGLDVEVIRREALLAAAEAASGPEEREHVTPYIYRRPDDFTLSSFRLDRYLGHVRLTVDHAADLERVREIVAELGTPTFGLAEIERVLGPVPMPDDLLVRPALPGDTDIPQELDLNDPVNPTFLLLSGRDPAGWAHVRARTGDADLVLTSGRAHPSSAYLSALRNALGLQVRQPVLELRTSRREED